MSVSELTRKLDKALEAHQKELEFVIAGDEPFSRDEIVQMAKTSYYTLAQFRDAIVEFAKSLD